MHSKRFLLLALAGLAFTSACESPLTSPAATCQSDLAPEAIAGDFSIPPAHRPDPARALTVTGTGVVFGEPDSVTAQLGVQTRGSDPGTAIADHAATLARVTAALTALGVEARDIQPGGFSTMPVGEADPLTGQLLDPSAYIVDSSVTVTFDDPQQLGEVLEKSFAAGVTTIHGVTHGMSDPFAPAARARELALADARARAEQMATAAGVSLGQPVTISESNTGSGPFSAEQAMMGMSPFGTRPFQVAHHVTVAYAIR